MIRVVNMMPRSLSGETNQDSEPNLAVNPANWREMAASAFTPNPGGSGNAPIYVTTDGGSTWVLNPIVPSAVAPAGHRPRRPAHRGPDERDGHDRARITTGGRSAVRRGQDGHREREP